ncbi:MAG: zinc ribbon domain-containing protein [Candidatus Heimdallarchaeota archaeon]
MAKKYCVYCGTEFSTEDKFCFKCGAKVNLKESVEIPVKSSDVSDYYIPETTTQKPRRRSKISAKKIITTAVIIGAILIPLSITMGVLSIKVPLGTLEYEVPNAGILDLDLVVDNEIGSVSITYDDSISNLFEAELIVKGGLKAKIEDAINFEHEVVGNRTVISFDSGDEIFSYFSLKSIIYEINILVNPIAVYDFNIITATGSIEFNSDNTNDVAMGDVSLKSSTGSVIFNFGNTINTSIQDLSLECSTGSIYADLGTNTTLFGDVIGIYTSTGSIRFYYEDIILTDDILWNIKTSTGSITLGIEQNILPAVNITSTFDVQTSTGSITLGCELDTDIGIEINAGTSTGSISLPNGHDYYVSANYATANLQYSFVLLTSTGSVSASV